MHDHNYILPISCPLYKFPKLPGNFAAAATSGSALPQFFKGWENTRPVAQTNHGLFHTFVALSPIKHCI